MANDRTTINPSQLDPNAASQYKPALGEVIDNNLKINDTIEKYSIDQYMYPSNLLRTDNPNPNYVMFYINISEDSKMLKTPDADSLIINDVPNRELGELRGKTTNGTAAKAVAEVEGGLAGGALEAFFAGFGASSAGALLGKTLGIGLGVTVGGATVGNVESFTKGFTRPTKRLKTAIALHVPNQLNIHYSTVYQQDDLGVIGTAAALAAANPEIANKLSHLSLTGITDDLKAMFKAGGSARAGVAAATVKNSQGLSFFSGLAGNPRLEQLFKGVNFRQFSFEYQFYARNQQEANNILNIIYLFKYHMHPEFKDPSNFLFLYPSEFDIQYYIGEGENKKLHSHTSCILTDMSINYTPNGSFQTHEDGMPNQINVALQFTELSILTKEKIELLEKPGTGI